jgi:hypothetical protein
MRNLLFDGIRIGRNFSVFPSTDILKESIIVESGGSTGKIAEVLPFFSRD